MMARQLTKCIKCVLVEVDEGIVRNTLNLSISGPCNVLPNKNELKGYTECVIQSIKLKLRGDRVHAI